MQAMKIQLIPSWSWVRRQGSTCSSCPVAKSLLEPVINLESVRSLSLQEKQFYVVRLALEPVGMLGARQQCWFAAGIWTIPVWTDMTKGLTISLGCLKPI